MSVLDASALLQPTLPEEPCGPDLQYDPDFISMESASQGKPEQQYGDTIIPAESPDWKEVKRLGLALLERSKDFRIACHLGRAMLATDGFAGFGDCLSLIRGYIEQYWENVHPQLDPEDDNDPTERVNIVASLSDKLTTVALLLDAPVVSSSMLGKFSMRDVLVAKGEMPSQGEDPAPEMTAIEAAFLESDSEVQREQIRIVEACHEDALAIEAAVTDRVGATNAVSMELLSETLRSILDFLLAHFQSEQPPIEDSEGSGDVAGPVSAQRGSSPSPAGAAPTSTAEIRSREDVQRALDRICAYFERYEPSSPVPLLLKRAKRLVNMSFIDILEDLTPEGVAQARVIGGVDRSDSEN